MEEEKQNGTVINHFEKDSSCQVFNAPVTGVFAMPGSTVVQHNGQAADHIDTTEKAKEVTPPEHQAAKREEKLCLFVHPSIDDEHSWQIHDEIKRLVARQGVQEICQYLLQMSKDHKVLLPQSHTAAYDELVRLGMPNGDKYNIKTFSKYYQR